MADNVDRISKEAFIGSTATFFGVCIAAACTRIYIRLCVHKKIGWDDGFLLFGLCCVISAIVLLYLVLDMMYLAEELLVDSHASIPLDDIFAIMNQSLYIRQMSIASLVLMWIAICSVKFSFLALFHRLIQQMTHTRRYWWFVVAYNIIAGIYGVLVFFVTCPYFGTDQMLNTMKCNEGYGLAAAYATAIPHMVFDVTGDLFILVIPFNIIWRIRVDWRQKIALFFSLCLTIVMVGISIARIIGFSYRGKVDLIWESYYIVTAAEVGLFLGAMTAFRSLFVARMQQRRERELRPYFQFHFPQKSVLSRYIARVKEVCSFSSEESRPAPRDWLRHKIPGATMTGLRSFLDNSGRTKVMTSSSLYSMNYPDEEGWHDLRYPPSAKLIVNIRNDYGSDCEELTALPQRFR